MTLAQGFSLDKLYTVRWSYLQHRFALHRHTTTFRDMSSKGYPPITSTSQAMSFDLAYSQATRKTDGSVEIGAPYWLNDRFGRRMTDEKPLRFLGVAPELDDSARPNLLIRPQEFGSQGAGMIQAQGSSLALDFYSHSGEPVSEAAFEKVRRGSLSDMRHFKGTVYSQLAPSSTTSSIGRWSFTELVRESC